MKSIDLVREFHERFGQEIHDEPRIWHDGANELRLKLLREELDELALALDDRDPVAALAVGTFFAALAILCSVGWLVAMLIEARSEPVAVAKARRRR